MRNSVYIALEHVLDLLIEADVHVAEKVDTSLSWIANSVDLTRRKVDISLWAGVALFFAMGGVLDIRQIILSLFSPLTGGASWLRLLFLILLVVIFAALTVLAIYIFVIVPRLLPAGDSRISDKGNYLSILPRMVAFILIVLEARGLMVGRHLADLPFFLGTALILIAQYSMAGGSGGRRFRKYKAVPGMAPHQT